jgi:hypothetical protein
MKAILAAVTTIVALQSITVEALASTHEFNVEEAINNKEMVLMALGAAVFYSENCMGLTHTGSRYLNRAIKLHNIDFYTIEKDKDYKAGYKVSEGYPSCNKLRSAISDAGLGAMIR